MMLSKGFLAVLMFERAGGFLPPGSGGTPHRQAKQSEIKRNEARQNEMADPVMMPKLVP